MAIRIMCKYMLAKSQVDGKGIGCRVVLNLGQRYLNAGQTIITDNFYT